MANRYANLVGSKKISEDFNNINIGFDRVQGEMETNKGTADSHIANVDIHVTAAKKAEWDAKAPGNTLTDLNSHKADAVVHVTQADHDKLGGIAEGAEVNQNAFATVNDIAAADPEDAVTIKGGVGITVTTNPTSKEVTVTATGSAAPGAHGTTHTEHGADPIPTATLTEGGIMSAEQVGELADHATAITALEDRLDTTAAAQLTLQPGLQVINSTKDSRFKLGEIKGKTEINGQGRTGIVGVENPYVINTSDNLLPPFYEWVVAEGSPTVDDAYKVRVSNANKVETVAFKLIPGATYSISAKASSITGRLFLYRSDTMASLVDATGSVELRGSFVAPSSNVSVRLLGTSAEIVEMYDITLTLGTESKPFKPQRKSMLAFQTELHSNPDGSEPDLLFEQNGEYKKLAKWNKVVLDGTLDWINASGDGIIGYKKVPVIISGITTNSFLTKYNGDLLPRHPGGAGIDYGTNKYFINTSVSILELTISNSDTGWGDSYTPTTDEIKAYFWGWKMYDNTTNPDGTGVYNRTDGQNKLWAYRVDGTFTGGTPTLPTSKAPNWSPYNLLYRLAKETVETVVAEGCLTLHEGNNVVEVGTGIVLRESAKFAPNTARDAYICNSEEVPSTKLKYKLDKVFALYKDSKQTLSYYSQDYLPYGNLRLVIDLPDYSDASSYSITYIKLDKSPIAPISGTLAASEKAQISDLTAGVAEALQRVSIVEQKKAEKDSPGWITPTLLNGWVAYGLGSYPTACFYKDSDRVYLDGLIAGGVIAPSTTIFVLPVGYRPKLQKLLSVPVNLSAAPYYGEAHLIVGVNGVVNILYSPGNQYLSLANLSFSLN